MLLSTTHSLGRCGYLDVSAELGGETFLLHIFNCSFTPEQVNSHTRRQEALMLLPLQRLEEKDADSGQKKSLLAPNTDSRITYVWGRDMTTQSCCKELRCKVVILW